LIHIFFLHFLSVISFCCIHLHSFRNLLLAIDDNLVASLQSRKDDDAIAFEIAGCYGLLMCLSVYYGPYESGVIYIQFYALWRNDEVEWGSGATLYLGVAYHAWEQTALRIGDAHLDIVGMRDGVGIDAFF